MAKTLILATRKSPLALVQAEQAQQHLVSSGAAESAELLRITTTGDRQHAWSLEARGGKGLFTKELEESLLRGEADLAVHSAKDLPTEETPGLELAGFLPRESVHDVLVCRNPVSGVPRIVATGSPRRRSQARHLFPEVEWCEIRGNVETRLKKIVAGDADATILAEAGLNRLNLHAYDGLQFERLPLEAMVPAAGQGAIALQCRAGEADYFRPWLCTQTGLAVTLERLLLAQLGGGCHTAVGVYFDGLTMHVFHEATGRVSGVLEAGSPSDFDGAIKRYLKNHLRQL